MKKKFSATTLLIVLSLIFNSCKSKIKTVDDGYFFQDFDNFKYWDYYNARVTNEQAHSGSYSAFTDSTHDTQNFAVDFDFAKSKGYKNMNVTAWCYLAEPSPKSNFVASVEAPDTTLVWESVDLQSVLTSTNVWGKVSKSIKLPENAPGGTKIKVYVFSTTKTKIFMDDVEIQFSK
jgi:hypothetical protein